LINQPQTTALLSLLSFIIALLDQTAHAVSIETVPIGNPGNPADTRYLGLDHPNGVGSVGYKFRMGETEVNNAQYVDFLNAVAASDPYGLYSISMGSSTLGGIVRSGATGSYSYAVKAPALSGAYTYDDKPVVFVSVADAMRFANWLHNGQPSGAEDSSSTTEDGAYTLNGAANLAALDVVTRNAGARWWLPSEDEWYKAAYHKNDGATGNYWDYPTGTNSVSNNNPPSADSGNSANFWGEDSGYTTGNSAYPLTNVGAYTLSASPYGTFDQGGNVYEWNETRIYEPEHFQRSIRGGSWYSDLYWDLRASNWDTATLTDESQYISFRLASIPEPSTLLLGAMSGLGLSWRRRPLG
jgi:formylglycine-generating enzyme required for sulfatase activity